MRRTLKEGDRVIYFTGMQGATVVGIGGSMKHLIGAPPNCEAGFGSSGFEIVNALEDSVLEQEILNTHSLLNLCSLPSSLYIHQH